MKFISVFIVVLFLPLLLSGCGGLSGIEVPEGYESTLPAKAEINVRIVSQCDNYSCATSSLAMVMSYYDHKMYYKQEVWDASGSRISDVRDRCGNDMNGLKRAAEKYGFTKFQFVRSMKLSELKYLISQDIPVIVNIKNFFNPKRSHAVVVTGYDEQDMIINDPSGRSYKIDNQKFLDHWYANLCTPQKGRNNKSAFVLYNVK